VLTQWLVFGEMNMPIMVAGLLVTAGALLPLIVGFEKSKSE